MLGVNQKPRALLAAAKREKIDRFKKVGEPWQAALWDIYRDLGPVHYGMTFKRAAAMRVNYFVAEIAEEQDEPVPTENERAVEAYERLGDTQTIVGDFVVQTNVAGEGYLNGTEGDEEDDFIVLSTLEVNERSRDDKNPLGDYLLRVWNPAPWKRSEPDAPLRSVQAQCEQLLLLNDEIGATSMSRVPAGFLLVPDELSFGTNAEDYPDDGANADGDPFMAEVIQIVTKAISDADSAARVAPNVIRGPSEYLDKFRYVDISRKMDEVFAGMREELLRQIAGGINLPAEILTGLADLNHWSLWGVDESTAKHHVDPDVLAILQGLTEGYLWPMLEEAGMGRDEARNFVIWRDYSDLTARPMTVEQAIELKREGIIADEYVRRIANIPEDMAGDGQSSQSRPVEDPRAMREPPENIAASAALDTRPLQEIDRSVATRIIEASEAAFNRALERAGVRVRNKARKDRQISAAIDGVEDFQVTRTLGWRRIEQLQLTMDQLLPEGEFDQLERRVNQILAEGQEDTRAFLSETFGEDIPESPEEEEDRITATEVFIAALFAIAGTRLFTDAPQVDPAEAGEFSDEIATGEMVVELLTRAGGGSPDAPDTPRGLALGQRTRAAFRDRGYRVESLTWQWGYYRTPRTPFEPHRSLNGAQVLDREDPRLNGRYPGDHRFCTCELVPTVLPEA